jgi:hypothetical protein
MYFFCLPNLCAHHMFPPSHEHGIFTAVPDASALKTPSIMPPSCDAFAALRSIGILNALFPRLAIGTLHNSAGLYAAV